MGVEPVSQQKQCVGFVTFTEENFIKDYRVTSRILARETQRTIAILKEHSKAQ